METKLGRIASKSANTKRPEFTSLYHLINKEMLTQCHRELDGSKAVGIDEVTKLGLVSFDITYLGVMKFLMKPDYFSPNERIEIGGLYGISLPNVNICDIYGMIKDKEEITKHALFSQVKNKEPIALIDEQLLEYYI